jgi:hypothetical protein
MSMRAPSPAREVLSVVLRALRPAAAAGPWSTEEGQDAAVVAEGERAALARPHRGPLELTAGGQLPPAVLAAFERVGFYVFTDAVGPPELADLRRDVADLSARAPEACGAAVDGRGRPAAAGSWAFARPLSDPDGGRDARSAPKGMRTFATPAGGPAEVVMALQSYLPHTAAGLRLYGHPGLLAAAAAVNGPDFTPFSESIQIKLPGLGPAVTWHQDGTRNWSQAVPEHGFNFMCQLHGSTAENGVWILPGSHRRGRLDIGALLAAHGDRLPGTVPMICAPGDVVMANRNALHGSFPNVSADRRVTLNWGFHRRGAVLGAARPDGVPWYTAAEVDARCRLIPLAAARRAEAYPTEPSFAYAGLGVAELDALSALSPSEQDALLPASGADTLGL